MYQIQKYMPIRFRHALRAALLAATALLAVSCDWIKEALPPCPPTELRLRFKYDYNMMRADVFKDHVGAVYVYVFDQDDHLVTMQAETEKTLLEDYNYEMVLPDLQPGKYRLVTLAYQKSREAMEQGKGAKFRVPDMKPGDPVDRLEIQLDREQRDGQAYVVNEGQPLDTLWVNRTDNVVETRFQETTRETVDLMRHTNNLSITLRQIDRPLDVDCQDFDIRIIDRNGKWAYDNTPLADEELVYTPYAVWNTEFKDDEGNAVQRAAHADLSFARLMAHDRWEDNALLVIYNKKTGKEVARINLPDYLSQGRTSTEYAYTPQEFLDREYNYKLDFFLKGDTWDYVELRISVLSWAIRIQNINL